MPEKNIFTLKWIILEKKDDNYIVRILSWKKEWKIVTIWWEKDEFTVIKTDYKVWDKIKVYTEFDQNEEVWNSLNWWYHYSIQWFRHLDWIIIWFFIFCWIVIWIWKKQWLMSLLSLFWWMAMILFLLIPWIKYWYNPVLLTWIISFVATILTILLITWNTKKSWVAIFWTILWVFFSYIFAFFIATTSWINWVWSEAARAFAILNSWFDYIWIFFSWIIIWALWAVMDTTISIASWLSEVNQKTNWTLWFKKLLKSGMNIWWDVMWWMINTLIFAYMWTSFVVVLSASINGIWIAEFLNFDFIAEEVLRMIAWTIWLILSIPITALLWAIIFSKIWKN